PAPPGLPAPLPASPPAESETPLPPPATAASRVLLARPQIALHSADPQPSHCTHCDFRAWQPLSRRPSPSPHPQPSDAPTAPRLDIGASKDSRLYESSCC